MNLSFGAHYILRLATHICRVGTNVDQPNEAKQNNKSRDVP